MLEMVAVCKFCSSARLTKLSGEICLHFPGMEGLNKPAVFVFPKLLVCFDCGFTESTLSETELLQIREASSSFNNGSEMIHPSGPSGGYPNPI
jgi:hypothetical protein